MAASVFGRVESVNLAVVRDDVVVNRRSRRDAAPQRTGIDKRPVPQAVRVHQLGVDGDTVCNGRLHGGVDQAVYAYGIEDARWWQEELGPALNHTLRAGSFGENLTTSGLDLTGAIIGERWQIGTAVLEVSVPRTPCRTFASFWKVPHLIRRFTAAARPGSYLRVLTPGLVRAGDVIEVVERPAHGLTVGETFRAMTGDRELAWKLLTAPQLPDSVLRQAHIWLTETA